ncbi:MAG: cystathionine gamma-synthase [Gammaproteobacteria bacterium]|jgi:cystathionine gamma-synthase|nr:cystathionine gamma-synthase [Gammaproteobacteria bacterium]
MNRKTEAASDPQTRAVRAGLESDPTTGAVVPPIHLSSTFAFPSFGVKGRYDYSRSGNPTRDLLAEAVADLEGGAGAVVTGSGMGAIALVGQILKQGARIVVPHDCYGGTFRLFTAWQRRGDFRVEFVDFGDDSAWRAALGTPADLVWVESPSNPLLRITDIREVARVAHAAGAKVAVDNTFLSPVLQQPLSLGADLVVHSMTKYLNGHSDVISGAVVAATAEDATQLAWWANALGMTGGAFDSFLVLRGLRTLHARMAIHEQNANELASWLQTQAGIRRVLYPGLVDHPGHSIARAQQRGFGAIVTIDLAGGLSAVEKLVGELQLFSLAESLGGVESLVAHPATMTHAAMDPAARAAAGLTEGLLRLSVGIEAVSDLRKDLAQALQKL